MPSTTMGKRCFCSKVLQRETIDEDSEPAGQEEWLPITIYVAKKNRCWYDHPLDFTSELISCKGISCSILYSCADHREGYTIYMAMDLNKLGVPKQEHPTILDKLFRVVSSAIPKGRILVIVLDLTVRLLGSFQDVDLIDTLMCEDPSAEFIYEYEMEGELRSDIYAMEGLDYHGFDTTINAPRRIFRSIPATKSSVERLQTVRLDCLEEPTRERNVSCSICRDDFGADQLVIPLPCTHCYHVDCIVSWLELDHLCPVCRYAMEADKINIGSR